MKNKYEIKGETTIVYVNGKNGSLLEVLIDTKDLELVDGMPNTWKITSDGAFDYIGAHLPRNGKERKFIRMHRYIMGAPKGKEVDHRNHNTFDNRRSNLRVLTKSENLQNRSGAQSNSKSGVRGVVWNKQAKKWRAQYTLNRKCYHVGTFDSIEEAEKAIKEARAKAMPYSSEGEKNE